MTIEITKGTKENMSLSFLKKMLDEKNWKCHDAFLKLVIRVFSFGEFTEGKHQEKRN